ncbi:MAG: hypothetical protein ACI3X4_03670 [Bacteroidaceae bacterium]
MNKSTNSRGRRKPPVNASEEAQSANMSLPKRVAYFLGRQFLFAEMSLCSKCKNGLPPVWTSILIVMGISLISSIIVVNVWGTRWAFTGMVVPYVFLMVCFFFVNPPQRDDDRLYLEMPPRKRRVWKVCIRVMVAVCWAIILYSFGNWIADSLSPEEW